MERHQLSETEISKSLDEAFSMLDLQRTEGLERLKAIQLVRNDNLAREKSRLGKKYGPDHPRLKKISDRIGYNKGVLKELDLVIERSKITAPDFDRDTWMVQGQVIDKNGNPAAGLTVSLQDEDKKWVRQLGYNCTDQRGYYSLRYRAEPGREPAFGAEQNLYLTVSDTNYDLLHRESEPLHVSIGHIDYRQVVLSGEICTPPTPRENETAVVPPDTWVVRGVVRFEDKSPASGLTVSLFDKELLFDDALGAVSTDENGRFKITYRTEQFRDLFEKKPDLYLKVLDYQGRELYNSKEAVCSEAGRITEFRIVLEHERSRRKE